MDSNQSKPRLSKEDEKIGQILLKQKLVTTKDLAEALYEQKAMEAKEGRKFKVGEILLFMKKISLAQLQGALQNQRNKADESRQSSIRARDKLAQKKKDSERWNAELSPMQSHKNKNQKNEYNGFISRISKIFQKK